MHCSSCGKEMEDGTKYCPHCGGLNPAFIEDNQTKQPPSQQPVQQQIPKQSPVLPKKRNKLGMGIIGILLLTLFTTGIFLFLKVEMITWIIAFVVIVVFSILMVLFGRKNCIVNIVLLLLIAILIGGGYYFTNKTSQEPKNNSVTDESGKTSEPDEAVIINSSIVSKGVNTDDLGNIISGQYYFSDGQNQYYSSFDKNNSAHIYKSTDNNKSAMPIFDGFGWSLVVKEGWLYFSGNRGQAIDGTYNLFRMKTDGSELQTLNDGYCYGMNIYNQWLYYNKRPSINATESQICRCELDGSNETVLASGTIAYFILFEDTLYYIDNSTTLYKAKPDGTNPSVMSQETIDRFIIGNGKIIYTNSAGDIKTMSTDGSKIKVVKVADGALVGSMNSYKDNIYYTEYDKEPDTALYSYKYRVHCVDFDGKKDKQVYEGSSWGFYINLLNDKLFVLDYAREATSQKIVAIAKHMTLSGGEITILPQ